MFFAIISSTNFIQTILLAKVVLCNFSSMLRIKLQTRTVKPTAKKIENVSGIIFFVFFLPPRPVFKNISMNLLPQIERAE